MQALRARFLAAAEETVAAFALHAERLAAAPAAPDVLAALGRELHRVRGTAGAYGFMEASRLAEQLEDRVGRWAADPALDVEGRARAVSRFAAQLRAALEAAPLGGSGA
jgi:chemotaxis protein histidine kinase CheA